MKKCILLIEDNEPIRENTAELLELDNYEVIVATDGYEGLEMLQARKPDLILCDILMPKMDGYDFLRAMRKDYRFSSLPFIFFTAYSEKKDIEKGIQMGATDYLVKPFEANELIRLIQKYLPKEVSTEL
jgi:CheY-like chemotaxis protein